jgi:hypothetical protein
MKRKAFLLFVSTIMCQFVFSQDINYIETYKQFTKGDTVYSWAPKTKLFSRPNQNSKLITEVKANVQFVIDTLNEGSYEYELNHPEFYPVQFNGKRVYVLSEQLAEFRLSISKSSVMFFHKKIVVDEYLYPQYRMQIRLCQAGEIVSETSIHLRQFLLSTELFDNKGLTDVDRLIFIHFHAQACGEEGGTTILTLKNDLINEIAQTINVGDAGVFGFSSNLIFPTDENGIPGKVIYTSELHKLYDEETEWETITTARRVHEWTGTQIFPEIENNPEW